jgi:hypothetical protein
MMTELKRVLTTISILTLILAGRPSDAQKSKAPAASSTTAPTAPAATSSSNAPLEIEMLSYGALDKIMDKIAVFACNNASDTSSYGGIVVLDAPALQALQAYDGFTVNVKALNDAFAVMQGTAGAGSGIDDFADITSAVTAAATASTAETSFSFTIQDPTAALVMLHHLQSQKSPACKPAAYAGVYGANEAAVPSLYNAKILSASAQLKALAGKRIDALKGISDAGQGTTKALRDKGGCAPVPTTAPAVGSLSLSQLSQADPCFAAFTNLDNSYNTFLQSLSGTNAATNQPVLSSILQGYHLRAALASGTTAKPLLGIYLNISAAGGTQQDRKNLFTSIFTGDLIRYSGGVSVNVIVFKIANGATAQTDQSQILYSDLLRYRTPLGHIKSPGKYDNAPEAGDNLKSVP